MELFKRNPANEHLLMAVQLQDVEYVKASIFNGADPNCRCKSATPLHTAALLGNEEIVEALLSYGADVSAKDAYGRTPLHYAAAYGHQKVVFYLLLYGANPNKTDHMGITPLYYAVKTGRTEIVNMMFKYNGNPDTCFFGDTLLHVAAYQGNVEMINLLLSWKASPNNRENMDWRLPLHLSILSNNPQAVRALLPVSDIFAIDRTKRTVLHLAARYANPETISELLSYIRTLAHESRDIKTIAKCYRLIKARDLWNRNVYDYLAASSRQDTIQEIRDLRIELRETLAMLRIRKKIQKRGSNLAGKNFFSHINH